MARLEFKPDQPDFKSVLSKWGFPDGNHKFAPYICESTGKNYFKESIWWESSNRVALVKG